jgi:hypothetical protein
MPDPLMLAQSRSQPGNLKLTGNAFRPFADGVEDQRQGYES